MWYVSFDAVGVTEFVPHGQLLAGGSDMKRRPRRAVLWRWSKIILVVVGWLGRKGTEEAEPQPLIYLVMAAGPH